MPDERAGKLIQTQTSAREIHNCLSTVDRTASWSVWRWRLQLWSGAVIASLGTKFALTNVSKAESHCSSHGIRWAFVIDGIRRGRRLAGAAPDAEPQRGHSARVS